MKLIIGLGNPGRKYISTWHNLGFVAIDELRELVGGDKFKKSAKFQAEIATGNIGDEKLILAKPQTFMNNSGQAVGEIARFYKIPTEDVIVLHDDIDLVFGKIKVKQGGGHAGHNGLRSIDSHIGKEYWRVRFGVSHPGNADDVADYVLNNFSKQEQQEVERLAADIARAFIHLVSGNNEQFLEKM